MGKGSKLRGGRDNKGRRIIPPPTSDVNPDRQKPVFSFEFMVKGYCIDSCDPDEKAQFADALYKRSKLSWAELRQAPRKGLGYEKITNLNVTIPPDIKEDVTIIAFRCIGKKPMIGYRDRRVFYVLWIDLKYSAYDHG